MHIELWPIDRPKPYPKNARKWNAAAVAKVASSIREYGVRQPIVVDVHDVIIIGHLRLAAAKTLGLKEVPVHIASDLTPAQVKAAPPDGQPFPRGSRMGRGRCLAPELAELTRPRVRSRSDRL